VPELPDITVYIDALSARVIGAPLESVRIANPFVLRTVDPSLDSVTGKLVQGVGRIGKRIVLALEDDLFLVIHLMIAGRLRWRPPGKTIPRSLILAHFDFPSGSLVLTEAGKKRRASLHLVRS
jgi:formamidopyrimidine-DNA glycosylase